MIDFSSSQCCRCFNKEIVWSPRGTCNRCQGLFGGVTRSWDAPEGCHYNEESDKAALDSSQDERAECRKKCTETAPDTSRSQCCTCKAGTVTWSASGTCSICKNGGGIDVMWDSIDGCRYERSQDRAILERDSGARKDCAKKCRGKKPEDTSWCCLCKDKKETVSWSENGDCGECEAGFRTRWEVADGCNYRDPIDKDELDDPSKPRKQDCLDKCINMQPERGESQCCLCKDGNYSWSASGTCSLCPKGVTKTWSVPKGCRYHDNYEREELDKSLEKRKGCLKQCKQAS